LKLFDAYEIMNIKLSDLITQYRQTKADQTKALIDVNIAAVRRIKQTLESNTTHNYMDIIYIKNLRTV
jgi:hypothetical protein